MPAVSSADLTVRWPAKSDFAPYFYNGSAATLLDVINFLNAL
jgi:hypothetical protein